MNMISFWGFIVGLGVGLLFVAIMLKLTKTDGSIKCKFDERQMLVRGKGAKYTFYTLMIYNLIYGIIESFFNIKWSDTLTGMVLGIILGVVVYASYCIWYEAYFSLNESPKKLLITFIIITILNLGIGIANLLEGKIIEKGMLTYHSINLMCGIMFSLILGVILVKKIMGRRGLDEA